MKKLTNDFKQNIKQGIMQYGYWLAMANSYTAEISATADFDWLLIDGEHAPNNIQTILTQLQAIAPYRSQPVVRAVEGTSANIKQLLDIGAHTLLIPMIETKQQAQAMVDAIYYPPKGNRGVGAAIARSSKWLAVENYNDDIEDNICLLLQVESQAGLDNLDQILEVEGYDGIFIGPSDLAASMGFPGQTGHPQVQQAIKVAADKIKEKGLALGTLSTEKSMIESYTEMGFTFIAVGVDTISFASSARELAKQYK